MRVNGRRRRRAVSEQCPDHLKLHAATVSKRRVRVAELMSGEVKADPAAGTRDQLVHRRVGQRPTNPPLP